MNQGGRLASSQLRDTNGAGESGESVFEAVVARKANPPLSEISNQFKGVPEQQQQFHPMNNAPTEKFGGEATDRSDTD